MSEIDLEAERLVFEKCFANVASSNNDFHAECQNRRDALREICWMLWIESAGRLRRYMLKASQSEEYRKEAQREWMKKLEFKEDLELLNEAVQNAGFDVSPCTSCGCPVICIPDGLALCRDCAEKDGG
jgi:hypothetical protein